MINVHKFTFNGFQENTYLLVDTDTNEAVVVDPGCYDINEKHDLEDFIASNKLKLVRLLNTHCHLDHIFGNQFIQKNWNLALETHEKELETLQLAKHSATIYGFPGYEESPLPTQFLDEQDQIKFGRVILDIIFVPGHAPGHIAFINHADKFVIGGDVLFHGSIGRTDLPGGDFDTLVSSIKNKFYTLPDDYIIYSGHGPETTIGYEKATNPFVKG